MNSRIISIFLMFISSPAFSGEAILEWSQSARHSFCQNFPAGHEADGKKLFVSQVNRIEKVFGISITMDEDGNLSKAPSAYFKDAGSSWHIGKAGTHLKQGMTYSYGGKEYDVGNFKFPSGNEYPHYTLCLTKAGEQLLNDGRIKWVSASNGDVPQGAVKGFNRKENQHVCRTSWGGGIHPGKLIPGQACFIGYGGGEKASKSYEVLVVESK